MNVADLTRRLADTPPDFLAEGVSVPAVVSDTLVRAGAPALNSVTAQPFLEPGNVARLRMVACWLLADPALVPASTADRLLALFGDELPRLAALVPAERFVGDPDRREELARITLRALGVQPDGETPAQSEDRLSTVDSVRRQEVLLSARAAEERAAQVRRALEDKRAQEAAARYSQV